MTPRTRAALAAAAAVAGAAASARTTVRAARTVAALLAAGAGVLLLAACDGRAGVRDTGAGEADDPGPPAAAEEVLPEYAAVTLDGDSVSLRDYRGEVLLLNVWATWCPPCRREMPSLQAVHEEQGPEGLRVVGVSIDGRGSEDKIRDFLAEYGITYTILHDPEERVLRELGIFGIPTTYLVDRAGRVVQRWMGEADFGAPDIRRTIREALASDETRR